jgi:arylsulfatase A-like enzyme
MDEEPYGADLRRKLPYVDATYTDGFDLKDLTALYYGMVSLVDEYVGRLMEILSDEGIEDDTIVVFTSDHGDNLGSRHLWNKGHIFDESIRIPLVFRWPGGIPVSRHELQVASLIDVSPTILGLLGMQAPSSVQGQDLSNVLEERVETTGVNLAFIEGFHPQIGVRTPSHLYGMEMSGKTEAEREPSESLEDQYFFDMVADPFQMQNLADDGSQSDLKMQLRRRLLAWHRKTPRLPI